MSFDYTSYGLLPSSQRIPLPGKDVPQHLAEILDNACREIPQAPALIGSSGRFSYEQLDQQVNRASVVLSQKGVRRYDRVAACLPNDVDIVIAFLACARLGAIWVGINRPLAGPEKIWLLENSGARVFLCDPPYRAEVEACGVPAGVSLITVDREIHAGSAWHVALQKANPDQAVRAADIDPFEPAAIAYTSGTTGFPKGAVHSHHNIMLPGAIAALDRVYGEGGTQGVMLPLTILNLMVLAPVTAFQYGAACVCIDGLKPDIIARWVKQERINHFASVPTVMYDLLRDDSIDSEDLASLGYPDIGGAGCPQEVQQLYKERFGRGMIMAYGMTEAPTIVAKTQPQQIPENDLCGQGVEQVEIVVVDANDKAVALDEVGEICVRPSSSGRFAGVYTTMLGYWKNGEASHAALANGVYHTGDLGCINSDGNLYIKGRSKELIIRGGANVYPAEVERVMMLHPAVECAAVLGVDDERLGQCVVAAVELNDADMTKEALLQYCLEQMARYKVPEQIVLVECLPRNAMNKVVKPQLVELFL